MAKGGWRAPVVTQALEGCYILREGKRLLSFASNDYLGLSQHPEVIRASQLATETYGAGAGASRLVSGNHPLIAQLEEALARFKGMEAACVFGSGYLANLGALRTLVERDDLVVADKLIHASLVDAAMTTRATLLRFRHNDISMAEELLAKHRSSYRNCLIVVDGVYSMDGDRARLPDLSSLCKKYESWLMVDDAHGFGILGNGRGTAESFEPAIRPEIAMGSFSKAAGSYGGYLAGSATLMQALHNHARSLIFSTGLPPAAVAASLAAIGVMQAQPQLCGRPLKLAQYFTGAMGMPRAQSAIVPLIVGESAQALMLSQRLQEKGFFLPAIRPPAVPQGTARLRAAFTALHDETQIDALVKALKQLDLQCAD